MAEGMLISLYTDYRGLNLIHPLIAIKSDSFDPCGVTLICGTIERLLICNESAVLLRNGSEYPVVNERVFI